MMIILYITIALLLIYGMLMGYYEAAWRSIPDFKVDEDADWKPSRPISVIIPARNEEENIGACLESLLKQTYPSTLFEIIVVDDHSTDRTANIVEQLAIASPHIKLIRLADHVTDSINSYKKKAIEIAITAATGELIVTTDADCIVTPEWIFTLAAFHDKYNAAFIAAPVKIDMSRSLLSIFQSLDFLTLQGITGASVYKKFHSMCNGANLAYEKKVFYEVDGFKGIDAIASGDDMLLMHKIYQRYPERVLYLKSEDVIVRTEAAATWKAFFHQRIRWASKADSYDDKRIFMVLLMVYLLNLLLLILLVGGIFNVQWLGYGVLLLGVKFLLEVSFVSSVGKFFGVKNVVGYFLLLQPLHLIYTVVAGFLGKFGRYEWKERVVK